MTRQAANTDKYRVPGFQMIEDCALRVNAEARHFPTEGITLAPPDCPQDRIITLQQSAEEGSRSRRTPPSALLLESDDGSGFTGTGLFPGSPFSEEIPNVCCFPDTSHLFLHLEGRQGSAPQDSRGPTVGCRPLTRGQRSVIGTEDKEALGVTG